MLHTSPVVRVITPASKLVDSSWSQAREPF
jgi:hypothetical protein